MNDNKNLILGSIAIIVVVIVAVVLFLPKGDANNVKTSIVDVNIYIHHDKTEDTEGYYSKCKVSTEDLVKIRNAYEERKNFTEDNRVTSMSINGDYKVIVGNNYMAFDKESNNIVYDSEYNSLFEFKSNIYDLVIKACQ